MAKAAAKAAGDRRVTMRPAPDTMVWLTALFPVSEGVGVYAALMQAADAARAGGDPRTGGQVMADTLFERVTGRTVAEGVDISVEIVMTDQALFAGPEGDQAAFVSGYGPALSRWVRDLIAAAECSADRVAAATLHRARLRRARRDREPGPTLPRRPGSPHSAAGPDLPNALLRRAGATSRPHRAARGGRADQPRQRTGAVRGVQPRQAGIGLGRQGQVGTSTYRRGDHTHGPLLHLSGTRSTRSEEATSVPPRAELGRGRLRLRPAGQ